MKVKFLKKKVCKMTEKTLFFVIYLHNLSEKTTRIRRKYKLLTEFVIIFLI
jgi:hypothetical protein